MFVGRERDPTVLILENWTRFARDVEIRPSIVREELLSMAR